MVCRVHLGSDAEASYPVHQEQQEQIERLTRQALAWDACHMLISFSIKGGLIRLLQNQVEELREQQKRHQEWVLASSIY